MNANIIIVGAFIEMIELAEENGLNIIGLIDNKKKKKYLGYPIIGKDSEASYLLSSSKEVPLIISPDSPTIRKKLHNYYKDLGHIFSGIISKEAKISKSARIGKGTIVQAMVNVSSECNIGSFVKLNTYCNVMHNCQIGNYTTVSPNSVILGNVTIGERCYIGSNSTILPNITLIDDIVIGAGAVVTKNLSEQGVYVGCPARRLLK